MLQIQEITTDTIQGHTNPAICVADDGEMYVVKGREALNAGLVKEFVCASLGIKFGLPIPPFELVEFPEELIGEDAQLFRRFGDGPCFASKLQPYLQEFDRTSLINQNAQLFRDLFVFDYLIQNDDRNFTAEYGGNPNLLVDSERESIFVIDHNLAFDHDFQLESFKKLHVGASYWFSEHPDLFNQHDYIDRIRPLEQGVDQILGQIPVEWRIGTDELFQDVRAQLSMYDKDEFWSNIK